MNHQCSEQIIPADTAGIERAAAVLRHGGLVGMPTETVYGLACNALDPKAVARVFEAKGRPRFDPLIVHVASAEAAWELAAEVPPVARQMAEAFWPGPMTLVLPKRDIIDGLVTSGLDTVGLRVPGLDVTRQLIEAAGVPVAAPSANKFGGVSPTCAADVVTELGDAVDVVLDGGRCERGVESTVISMVADGPVVLRLGGVAVEQIEWVIGRVAVATGGGSGKNAAEAGDDAVAAGRASPGMLDRHYAPRTPLTLHDELPDDEMADAGLLSFVPPIESVASRFAAVRVLTEIGDVREAAANLFRSMRELDADPAVKRIIAMKAPDRALGRAINDRLRRASTPL